MFLRSFLDKTFLLAHYLKISWLDLFKLLCIPISIEISTQNYVSIYIIINRYIIFLLYLPKQVVYTFYSPLLAEKSQNVFTQPFNIKVHCTRLIKDEQTSAIIILAIDILGHILNSKHHANYYIICMYRQINLSKISLIYYYLHIFIKSIRAAKDQIFHDDLKKEPS